MDNLRFLTKYNCYTTKTSYITNYLYTKWDDTILGSRYYKKSKSNDGSWTELEEIGEDIALEALDMEKAFLGNAALIQTKGEEFWVASNMVRKYLN